MSAPLPTRPVGVVLAAGFGSRLDHGPKPLKRVAGTTLLERALATLRQAGVGPVIVVVGHAKGEIERFVSAHGLDVELVENGDFHLGNGTSALVGGRAAAGRFVVVMADHVFEPEAVRSLLESAAPFALAVDTRPRFCELEEATKVRIAGDRILAVGRDLDPCDGVDVGLAACDRDVIAAGERALAAGAGSWNDVKRQWIEEGRELTAVDLAGSFWTDVDTPADADRAERLLVRRAARKRQDGLVSRLVNRRFSWRLSLLFVRLGLTPSAVTALTFALTLVAAATLALGARSWIALVAGGVLVQLVSIVDGCDGEVARASLRSSQAGAFLDAVLDRIGDSALLVALAIAAGFGTTATALLVAALVVSSLVPYVRASYEATFRRPLPPSRLPIGGHDVRLLAIALSAVVLQPLAGLAATVVLGTVELAARLLASRRGLATTVDS